MLISHGGRFIFLHVPKTAGLSIREALKGYAHEPEKFRIERPAMLKDGKPNPVYDIWRVALLHAKAQDVRKEIGEELYTGYYKFAFVRNPWDWHVSMFHFLKHMMYKPVARLNSFEEYLEWVVRSERPFPKGAAKFQKEILTDRQGLLIVDFVGRYENLANDFAQVCRQLNINADLPRLNSSPHGEYRAYYTDRTRDMVADYFKPDIELFGYTF